MPTYPWKIRKTHKSIVSHSTINERFKWHDTCIPASSVTLSSFWILEWKNAAFTSFPRSTSIIIMRQSSLFLKSESKICPRIPTFPSFVSHKLLEIIGFPAFPGTSSQAFPAFLYQSKTFPAFPEIPILSIPSYPIFPSSTYKNFNIFKNLKVGKLGLPRNSHFTQLFSQLLM